MLPAPVVAPSTPTRVVDQPAAVDSIVLERTSGYSERPAYRVRVARDGTVRFARQQGYRDPPGPRTGAATVSAAVFRELAARADSSGVAAMPAAVRGDPVLCPAYRTDAASAIVAVYRAGAAQRVDVYLGCRATRGGDFVPRVRQLVALADAIDAASGTRRWLRAAGRDG